MNRVLIAAAYGILAALVVVIQTLALWPLVYAHVPWPGYEYANAHGFVDRYFTESPAALAVSLLVLFAVALVTLKKSASFRLLSAMAFWFTSGVALCGAGFFFSGFRESNLLPLAILIIAFYAAIPALLGWLTAIVLSRSSSVPAAAMCVAIGFAILAGGACQPGPAPVPSNGNELEAGLELRQERVAEVLARWPGAYFGNVQEVVDASDCFGPKDGSACHVRVRVVELVGTPLGVFSEFSVGREFDVIEMRMAEAWPRRSLGKRRLAITTATAEAGTFGNVLFLPDPTPEQTRLLASLLQASQSQQADLSGPHENPLQHAALRVAVERNR